MFEILREAPLDVVVEVVYQAMQRLNLRAPHQEFNDRLAPGVPDTPEKQALRSVLHEIRVTEGKKISELSEETAGRYIRVLSDIADSRHPPLTPEQLERGLATLEEMRRKYGRAA